MYNENPDTGAVTMAVPTLTVNCQLESADIDSLLKFYNIVVIIAYTHK
jgi:hypothetical protein